MMKKKRTLPLIALLCVFVLSACVGTGGVQEQQIVPPGQATPGTPEETPSLELVIPAHDKPVGENPPVENPVIRLAREDLAEFLGVAANTVALTLAEEMTWSDGSLGCPQPGAMYPQVLTPGFYLILTVDGVDFTYHTDMNEQVIQCADPSRGDKTVPDATDLNLNPLITQAKDDLVERLDVASDEIEVVLSEAVVWPDAGMGCPQPDMKYKQVPQDGARIVLRVGNALYTYHSGGGRAPFLCDQPLQLIKKTPGMEDEMVPPPGFDD